MNNTYLPVPNIIGLTGYAQHGKNTVGDALERLGYRQLGFADQLRKLASIVNPYVNQYDRYNDVVADLGYEGAKQMYPEVRRILQELGTGVRDVIGENAWVAALTKQLMPGVKYVITDVRFPNEAQAVIGLQGEVWRVVRPNFDNGLGTDHASEAHVASLPAIATMVNDDTMEDLQTRVRHYVGMRGTL